MYNNKKYNLLGKNFGVIPLVSNPGIGAWYSGLCGEGCCPSCWTTWGGDSWGGVAFSLFVFFCFPWSHGPSVKSGSSDVVSPGNWVVSSIWFLLSTVQVAIGA
jgi:hypothetical protein